MFRKMFNRLKEPSSLAGLSALAMLFGVKPEIANVGLELVIAVLAAAAVVVPEKKAPAAAE